MLINSWYVQVNDSSVEQGDVFLNVPVLIPNYSSLTDDDSISSLESFNYDIIVISQTCDIVQKKIDSILVCTHDSITDALNRFEKYMLQQEKPFNRKQFVDEVEKGRKYRYLILNGINNNGSDMDKRLVDLSQVFLLPKDYITELAKEQVNRYRLRSPFREYFSHAFAHFISRIALP